MKLRCATCGGDRIQELKLCWARVNDDSKVPEVQVDYDSDPGTFYGTTRWCLDCERSVEFTTEETDPAPTLWD